MVLIKGIPQGQNGMFTYINKTKEEGEPPHVHVKRGSKQRKGDLKFWLDEGEFEASTKKGYTQSELRKLKAYFAIYHEDCMAEWTHIHGEPKPRH